MYLGSSAIGSQISQFQYSFMQPDVHLQVYEILSFGKDDKRRFFQVD
jgi:hypothetical protein